jgi:hypothetical protein
MLLLDERRRVERERLEGDVERLPPRLRDEELVERLEFERLERLVEEFELLIVFSSIILNSHSLHCPTQAIPRSLHVISFLIRGHPHAEDVRMSCCQCVPIRETLRGGTTHMPQ